MSHTYDYIKYCLYYIILIRKDTVIPSSNTVKHKMSHTYDYIKYCLLYIILIRKDIVILYNV